MRLNRISALSIIVAMGLVFFVDLLTPRGMTEHYAYLLIVYFAVRTLNWTFMVVTGLSCISLLTLGFLLQPAGIVPFEIALVNRIFSGLAVLFSLALGWHEQRTDLEARRNLGMAAERIEQLKAVAALGRKALRGGDLTTLLDEATIIVAKELKAHYSKVLKIIPGERMCMISGYGWKGGVVGNLTFPMESDLMESFVLREQGAVISGNVHADPRFRPHPAIVEHGVTSSLCVKIQSEGAPFGILQADTRQERYFNEDDVYFLEAVATILAEAVRRKGIEDELRRANLELEQFASVASHDLQEPIRKILTFGERLEDAAPERRGEYAAKIRNAGSRMHNLVQDLLTFSRVKILPDLLLEEIELGDLVQEVLLGMDLHVEESRASIHVGDLPRVKGNAGLLYQLFENLFSNALKYRKTAEPPAISVAARVLSDDVVEISVTDNGIGFDQSKADNIFQPFTRLHGRGAYEGTGMGLAICRKIVEKHRGWIRAESAPGKGATFRFTLPRA